MPEAKRVAIVTGASSGIGRAIAVRLAADGYRVFGASRRRASLVGVEDIALDVTDDASVAAGARHVLDAAGRVDLLVNNAGFAMVGAIEESSSAQAQTIFDTNLFGAMRMTRALLPTMRTQGQGRIISISSIVGFLPAPFSGLYAATKHALEGWSESLDHEVRTMGIRAILIEPGFTRSSIDAHMPEADSKLDVYERGREGVRAVFAEALAKAAAPDAVATTVARAASAPSPEVRYAVGREARTLATLRRLLPTSMFEKSFRKQFRLDD